MKNISSLTNKQKAILLHRLFPEVIPHFLGYVKDRCEDPEHGLSLYLLKSGFRVDIYRTYIDIIYSLIEEFSWRLETRRKDFCDLLFDGDVDEYIIDFLIRYVRSGPCTSLRFTCAVELLFMPDDILAEARRINEI